MPIALIIALIVWALYECQVCDYPLMAQYLSRGMNLGLYHEMHRYVPIFMEELHMGKMKLRTKLIGGFGFCVLVIAVLSGYTILRMSTLGQLQDEGANKARASEIATEASFIGHVSYSIIADAVINRNLEELQKDWLELKKKNQELMKNVQSVISMDEERNRLRKAEDEYNQMVKRFEDDLLPLLKKGGDPEAVSKIDDKIDSHKKGIRENLYAISESLRKDSENADKEYDSHRSRTIFFSLILAAIGIAGAIVTGILITLSITRPLYRVINGLAESADQVASASSHISSSSQQLAEGASQQAAAVEETSSSLEEMSSMTRRNADNAGHANDLMGNAVQVVGRANRSMSDLTTSMGSISRASEETQKIIKTIDEIAFQTNLLALNAAVEAARAGEAGAGFAVVADEVRNLALRAADAAKNTAALIEGTVKEIRLGTDIVSRTNTDFSEVSTGVSKVGELVGEISAASREQAQGIELVNKAVTEMDKVTQQNAASAEESASASEEMNAQAGSLRMFVSELSDIIGHNAHGATEVRRPPRAPRTRTVSVVVSPKKKQRSLKASAHSGETLPAQIIPFDEDDF